MPTWYSYTPTLFPSHCSIHSSFIVIASRSGYTNLYCFGLMLPQRNRFHRFQRQAAIDYLMQYAFLFLLSVSPYFACWFLCTV